MKLKTLIRTSLLCFAAVLTGAPATAHHSTAVFEWGKEKTLEGTVDKFEWTQPHTFIWVDVKGPDGKTLQWGFEGMSPSWLGRNGWNSKSIAKGAKVKIAYYPLRDGRHGGFFVRIILPDGKTFEAMPRRSG